MTLLDIIIVVVAAILIMVVGQRLRDATRASPREEAEAIKEADERISEIEREQ